MLAEEAEQGVIVGFAPNQGCSGSPNLFDKGWHVNTLVPVPEGYCFQSQPDRLERIAERGFRTARRAAQGLPE